MTEAELIGLMASITQSIKALQEQNAASHQQSMAELQESRAIADSNAQSIKALQEQYAADHERNAQSIKALQEQYAADHEKALVEIRESRAIADSNARTIGGVIQTLQDDRAEREEAESQLQVRINKVAQLIQGYRSDRRSIWDQFQESLSAQVAEISQQITVLREDANADRKATAERFDAVMQQINEVRKETAQQINEVREETAQQFESLIESNREEHEAFQESMQTQLVEIAKLWQQVQAS